MYEGADGQTEVMPVSARLPVSLGSPPASRPVGRLLLGPHGSGLSLPHAALDAAHAPPGRQRHLHRLSHVSHVRNHSHPGVQAAARVREEGAPETQDGPVRWVPVAGEGSALPVASVILLRGPAAPLPRRPAG